MLEKILEETERLINFHYEDDSVKFLILKNLRNVRKHMNDGWIPCEERLPEYMGGKIRVWMTVANGHVVEGFYDGHGFKFKNGQKMNITVKAWKEKRKPEPYRPEKGDNNESKEKI